MTRARAAQPTSDTPRYFVQVGSFTQAENVETLVNRLQAAGFDVSTTEAETPTGTVTKVQVGPAASRDAADELLNELKRRNVVRMALFYLLGAWVVLQVADVLFEALELPAAWDRLVLALVIISLLAAIFIDRATGVMNRLKRQMIWNLSLKSMKVRAK